VRAGLELRQVEQLRELRLESKDGVLDIADQRLPRGFARPCREGCRIEAKSVQRLPQVVACRCEQLALGAVGRFRGGTRFLCGARLAFESVDEIDVFVANCE
jgi:hypothetical protein